jgi:hypothetical protein
MYAGPGIEVEGFGAVLLFNCPEAFPCDIPDTTPALNLAVTLLTRH